MPRYTSSPLLLACAAIMMLSPLPARADTHSATGQIATDRMNYLATSDIAVSALPKPHAVGSKAWKNEVETIIQMQNYIWPTELVTARAEQQVRPEIITTVLGVEFTRTKFPQTHALLDRVGTDSHIITGKAKDFWHIPRPYTVDQRVKLQIEPLPPTNFAYPSGHTSISFVWAEVLSDLIPSAAPALRLQAQGIAARRLVAGVHTPDDIAGGKILGELIYTRLKTSPSYQTDLATARAELQAANYPRSFDCSAHQTMTDQPEKKNWKSFPSRITEEP